MENNNASTKNIIIFTLLFIINLLLISGVWYYFHNQIIKTNAILNQKNIAQQTNAKKIQETNLLVLCLQNLQYANMVLQTQGSMGMVRNLLNQVNELLSKTNDVKYSPVQQNIAQLLESLNNQDTPKIQDLFAKLNKTEEAVAFWLKSHPAAPSVLQGKVIPVPEISNNFYQQHPWVPKFWLQQINEIIKKQVIIKQYDANIGFIKQEATLQNQDYLHFIFQRIRWALLSQNNGEWQAALDELIHFLNSPILHQMPSLKEYITENIKLKTINISPTTISLLPTIQLVSDLLRS